MAPICTVLYEQIEYIEPDIKEKRSRQLFKWFAQIIYFGLSIWTFIILITNYNNLRILYRNYIMTEMVIAFINCAFGILYLIRPSFFNIKMTISVDYIDLDEDENNQIHDPIHAHAIDIEMQNGVEYEICTPQLYETNAQISSLYAKYPNNMPIALPTTLPATLLTDITTLPIVTVVNVTRN
jgi:hypothetical protein